MGSEMCIRDRLPRPDSSTRSTKVDQLTVDLAWRAHQSPGRLVDEDGLRGLPLAQRTGQGQSGVVAFLVWEGDLSDRLHQQDDRGAGVPSMQGPQ